VLNQYQSPAQSRTSVAWPVGSEVILGSEMKGPKTAGTLRNNLWWEVEELI